MNGKSNKSDAGASTNFSGDDGDAFQQAMRDVRRLKFKETVNNKPKRAPIPTQRLRDERAVLEEMAHGEIDDADIETGDELFFRRAGIQDALFRKLRRGELAVAAELDLHGYTSIGAKPMLINFIQHAQQQDWRCVRVIHGKGLGSAGRQPVLKGKVNTWLRQIDAVLAFSSARQVDGGTGALYVLLKHQTR